MVQFKNKRQGGSCSPCCTPPPCPTGFRLTLTVRGCHAAALPGATAVISRGGVTYDTEVTDAAGQALLDVPSAGVVPFSGYSLAVTHPDYANTSGTVSVTSCTSVGTLTMGVPTGRHCFGCCPHPQPTTLAATTGLGSGSAAKGAGNYWEIAQSGSGGASYTIRLVCGTLGTMTVSIFQSGVPNPYESNSKAAACGPVDISFAPGDFPGGVPAEIGTITFTVPP